MKSFLNKYGNDTSNRCVLLMVYLLCNSSLFSQQTQFEITSRQPLSQSHEGFLGLNKKNATSTFVVGKEKNNLQYRIQSNGSTFDIDALSSVEYAGNADRIVVFGDLANTDVIANCYAKIYSGNGKLIKSLGLVASFPYINTLTDNGHFIIAGNKNKGGAKPAMALTCFDPNGNKEWETHLPNLIPVNVFGSADNNYTAVVLYNPETMSQGIYYYNRNGRLLFVNNKINGISGIEFLPSGKVVITAGSHWYLQKSNTENTILASGLLPGNTVGRYPITAHPSKDIFFIVSAVKTPSKYGLKLQAFSARDGSAIAEKDFDGQPYYSTNRVAAISTNGRINLITSKEIIGLRISQ